MAGRKKKSKFDELKAKVWYRGLIGAILSRLFEKGLGMMEVASITGHKTLHMLKRYTHLKAEDLAKKLG